MRTLLLLLTTVLVAYVPAVAQDTYILHPIARGFSPATDINDHGVAVGWWIGSKVTQLVGGHEIGMTIGVQVCFEISTNGSKGIATIIDASTGAFLYTPFNANGADVFTFSASDGQSASGAATVSVDNAPVNDPSIAQNGAIDVVAGASATGSLSAFDIDSPTLTYTILENGTKGSVVVDATTGSFTYTAAANSIGTDAFTFGAWDEGALSNEGLIAINIAPAPPCAAGECPGAIDALIHEVNALPLGVQAKRLLVRTLETARTALNEGRERPAIALLRVFITELERLLRRGLLSGATTIPLIASARAIIDSVEG